MMKLKKIVFVVMLLFCFCMGSIPSVFAKEVNYNFLSPHYPMWANTDSIDAYIEESNSGLDAYVVIVPNDSDKQVSGKLYLQKYKNGRWSTIKNWTFSGRGYTEVCKSYSTNSGKYRTKVSVSVGGEYISLYSNEKTIN